MTAFLIVLVIAVSAVATITIAARLVLAIARRAIERTPPDKMPALIDALARMLGQLGQYLPWSSQPGVYRSPVHGTRAPAASHPELPEEEA